MQKETYKLYNRDVQYRWQKQKYSLQIAGNFVVKKNLNILEWFQDLHKIWEILLEWWENAINKRKMYSLSLSSAPPSWSCWSPTLQSVGKFIWKGKSAAGNGDNFSWEMESAIWAIHIGDGATSVDHNRSRFMVQLQAAKLASPELYRFLHLSIYLDALMLRKP